MKLFIVTLFNFMITVDSGYKKFQGGCQMLFLITEVSYKRGLRL